MSVLGALALAAGAVAVARHLVAWPRLARYLRRARVASIPKGATPPISLLKPVYGVDPGLRENLEGTLRQNYPEFEVLFLHERPDEPALAVIEDVRRAVPDVPVRTVCGRDPDAVNPKAAVLIRGEKEARFDIVASADADVRPDPLWLRDIANGLADADAVSFPPVMFGMRTLGARIFGLFSNTDLLVGLFAMGPRAMTGATIGVRRDALGKIGGYRAVADRIADDYELGLALGRAGCRLAHARRAARVYAPGGTLRESAAWAVRWARTIRAAAPVWTVLAMVTTFAPALLLAALVAAPERRAAGWTLLGLGLSQALWAVAVDLRFCWDRSLVRALPLLPLVWLLQPVVGLLGFGGTVTWRGRRYRLAGGRARLMHE